MVDYPNSKKARKVSLCLFVGDGGGGGEGGGAKVPEGLQGDEESEDVKVKFERRRQRELRRERRETKSGRQERPRLDHTEEVRVSLVKSASFPSHGAPFPTPALPETREGGRASRLQVYGSQKKTHILECDRHSYCCIVLMYPANTQKRTDAFVLLSCG